MAVRVPGVGRCPGDRPSVATSTAVYEMSFAAAAARPNLVYPQCIVTAVDTVLPAKNSTVVRSPGAIARACCERLHTPSASAPNGSASYPLVSVRKLEAMQSSADANASARTTTELRHMAVLG